MHAAQTRLKRFIPTREKILSYRVMRYFGKWLDEPRLWQFNRHSVPVAFSIGLFVTYIPFLGHMILATFLAILFRANLPLSLALVWVVNPFTMIPLFGLALAVGAGIFGVSLVDFQWTNLEELSHLWLPFVVGCLATGTASAAIGHFLVKSIWRYRIGRKWRKRLRRRSFAKASI